MDWVVVIGLEIHVQLKTKSKMFCRCSAQIWNEPPNSHVCPVCLGLPGALPVINKEAIKKTIIAGLALKSNIQKRSFFERKHYFYPDLPKGYQISQYQSPICLGGWLVVEGEKVDLERAHLEEDAGKLLHVQNEKGSFSLIDFNRSGVPLLEIVSKPQIDSPRQAVLYAQKIQQLLRFSEVSDTDMEKGSLRVDANISLRKKGETRLGVKVEVKNMNSFRSLERALSFEVERQAEVLESGKKIHQETRGWLETKGVTVSQRSKEEAHDYRYFPDPDLPPFNISVAQVKKLKNSLPEMPDEKVRRLVSLYALTKEQAVLISQTKNFADWYEQAVRSYCQTETASTEPARFDSRKTKEVYDLMANELLRLLNGEANRIDQAKILPTQLAELLYLRDKGEILRDGLRVAFAKIFLTGDSVNQVVDKLGVRALKSASAVEVIVGRVIKENPQAIEDLKKGKEEALGFLIGRLKTLSQESGISPSSLDANEVKKQIKAKIGLS